MTTWNTKWKKILIWFSGYFSFTTLAIVGGYTIVKSKNEELKKTAKEAFIVTLIFAAINAFFSIFYDFLSTKSGYSLTGAYDFYQMATAIVDLAKVIVFAVFIIMTLVKKDEEN